MTNNLNSKLVFHVSPHDRNLISSTGMVTWTSLCTKVNYIKCELKLNLNRIEYQLQIIFFIRKMKVKLSNFLIVHKDPHLNFEPTISHTENVAFCHYTKGCFEYQLQLFSQI
jgi:hypothetical protein